ncbi:PIG-L deacetylase family protein [Acinetobacter towneri]|uniref:PIG-L deacetylase family protein n=1 Tax=Acinetobacter towneri TaxID=202956 RepID=UPI0032130046
MKVLILAPHADDEVIGMGGTIAKLTSQGHEVVLAILTGPGEEPHPIWPSSLWDDIRTECLDAAKILGITQVIFKNLPAACLDHYPTWKVNGEVDKLIQEVNPVEVYIPFQHDLHQDHGVVNYAALVALRPYLSKNKKLKRVLCYETLSETHLAAPYLVAAFQPNIFVDIDSFLEKKLLAMAAYKSQVQPSHMPRSLKSLESLAHIRGTHIGSMAAEGFVLIGEYQR